MGATIVSVQVGLPTEHHVPLASGRPGPPLLTAIWKEPVAGPVLVGRKGAQGDGVGDLVDHGGPDKALCVYVADHLPEWSARLGQPMTPGAFGENLSVSGTDETEVAIGDVFTIGTTVVQVTQPRAPCATLARRWGVRDLVVQVRGNGRTGWYLRVLEEGVIEAGDAMALSDRPQPAWTIARCNAIAYGQLDPQETRSAAASGQELDGLSQEWQMLFKTLADPG